VTRWQGQRHAARDAAAAAIASGPGHYELGMCDALKVRMWIPHTRRMEHVR